MIYQKQCACLIAYTIERLMIHGLAWPRRFSLDVGSDVALQRLGGCSPMAGRLGDVYFNDI